MLVNPTNNQLVISHTDAGGAGACRIVVEYALLDALNILSVDTVSYAPTSTTYTVAMPTIPTGQRMKVLRIFLTSFADPLDVSVFVAGLSADFENNTGITGNFGRASVAAGEMLVYNEGTWTVYAVTGDVRVPV